MQTNGLRASIAISILFVMKKLCDIHNEGMLSELARKRHKTINDGSNYKGQTGEMGNS